MVTSEELSAYAEEITANLTEPGKWTITPGDSDEVIVTFIDDDRVSIVGQVWYSAKETTVEWSVRVPEDSDLGNWVSPEWRARTDYGVTDGAKVDKVVGHLSRIVDDFIEYELHHRTRNRMRLFLERIRFDIDPELVRATPDDFYGTPKLTITRNDLDSYVSFMISPNDGAWLEGSMPVDLAAQIARLIADWNPGNKTGEKDA